MQGKSAKATGDETERQAAALFKQNCVPANVQLGLSTRGALAFDLVLYPQAMVVNSALEAPNVFQANVIVRMSDYLVTKHKDKFFIAGSSGLDPLDLAKVGVANADIEGFLSKRAGGSIKDEDGNKLYRPASLAFRFRTSNTSHHVELTPDICDYIKSQAEAANTIVTFDVKAGKRSQIGGASVIAYANSHITFARKEIQDTIKLRQLLSPYQEELQKYMAAVEQDVSSFNVLIDQNYCDLNSIEGVKEEIYNAIKFNIKLTSYSKALNLVYQSLCSIPAHPKTHFEVIPDGYGQEDQSKVVESSP